MSHSKHRLHIWFGLCHVLTNDITLLNEDDLAFIVVLIVTTYKKKITNYLQLNLRLNKHSVS